MPEHRVITYPRESVEMVADRLSDLDWNLPGDEAQAIAFDIVTEVTMAVDKLRASEANAPGEKEETG